VFTEIDHNYFNPVSEGLLEKINNSFSNREKWAKGDVTSAYGNQFKIFNEYMTFAVYSLYINDNYSNKESMEYLPMLENQMENSRGFVKFKAFNRILLEKYKENPDIKVSELYNYILDWELTINKST